MDWFTMMYKKERELDKREAELHEREQDAYKLEQKRKEKESIFRGDLMREYVLDQREKELDEYSDNLDAQAERLKEQEEKTCLTVRWNLDRLAEKLRKQDLDLCERRRMIQIQEEETAKKFKRAHEKEKELNERESHIEREGQLNQCAAEVLVQREKEQDITMEKLAKWEREIERSRGKDLEIDLVEEIKLSKKYPEDRMNFIMPDGLEVSMDRRHLNSISRTTPSEDLPWDD